MPATEDIKELLLAGRYEYSLERSNQYLKKAAELAAELNKASASWLISLLAKEAYKELALNEARPTVRTELWLKALAALQWCKAAEIEYASGYAELIVDICQDPFSDMPNARRNRLLTQAKTLVNETTLDIKENEHKAIMLARKSAIIRLQAVGLTQEQRLRLLSEASRCSGLARDLNPDAPILLECALVQWALARLQTDDKKYVAQLQIAEDLFKHKQVMNYDLGPFAASRFYRLTYRYYDACLTFPQLTEFSKNRRRILRGASIYAESAIQLSNLHYPSATIAEHLDKALDLLELAISSGCKSAREVIALAYIRSLKEGATAGITTLVDLCPGRGDVSWEQALDILSQVNEGDLPAEGFALGVTDSSALTRLGTYANRFLKNSRLAEGLYRAAVRMNPQDAVAQTNLARFLVRRAEPTDLREAERVIQLAQTFSDRRFSWWRPLLLELRQWTDNPDMPRQDETSCSIEKLRSFRGTQRLRVVRQHYNRLKACEDHQFRGYELERLIYALSQMSFGIRRPSYRFNRPLVDKIHQVDSFMEHRGEKYRCECKWQIDKVSYDDMLKFADKIDVFGVSGLFFSMSGFTDAAINKSRELRSQKAILLVDGDEVDMLMNGTIHFDDLLTAKRQAFDSISQTYFRVNPSLSDG